mgnify:CR=1 FL=1
MQNNMNRHEQEKLEAELELLNLRLATAEAECEKIQQELCANELLQNQGSQDQSAHSNSALSHISQIQSSNTSGHGIHLATASVFAVITLSVFSVYHDALSLSLIHISEPTRPPVASRMPSSA